MVRNVTEANIFFRMYTLIEIDHLGDWSPEKDCCLQVAFQNVCLHV